MNWDLWRSHGRIVAHWTCLLFIVFVGRPAYKQTNKWTPMNTSLAKITTDYGGKDVRTLTYLGLQAKIFFFQIGYSRILQYIPNIEIGS